jgi:hypothetical protein
VRAEERKRKMRKFFIFKFKGAVPDGACETEAWFQE